jgi:hypothetical protein
VDNNKLNKLRLPSKTIRELWSRVDCHDFSTLFNNEQNCYEWLGPFDNYKRPVFNLNGESVLVKKLMYQLCIGPIEEEKVVANHCRNKKCVRPEHLYQAYFFLKEVAVRIDQTKSKSKKKVQIDEYAMLKVFNGIHCGRLKTITDIGEYLKINDEDVIHFITNDKWHVIYRYYMKEDLDRLRSMIVGL